MTAIACVDDGHGSPRLSACFCLIRPAAVRLIHRQRLSSSTKAKIDVSTRPGPISVFAVPSELTSVPRQNRDGDSDSRCLSRAQRPDGCDLQRQSSLLKGTGRFASCQAIFAREAAAVAGSVPKRVALVNWPPSYFSRGVFELFGNVDAPLGTTTAH